MNHSTASALMLAAVVGFGHAQNGKAKSSSPLVEPAALQSARPSVTYTKDIASIFSEHCTTCHRTGGAAPFSLQSFGDVRPRLRQIAASVSRRSMPPWKPEPGFGDFQGTRLLSERQISLIQQWIEQGAREGEPMRFEPVAPATASTWQLGEPDLVIGMPQPYKVRGKGTQVFRTFVVPVSLSERRYVKAWEFQPGNPRVVHHATMQLDARGASLRRDEDDPEPGFEGEVPVSAMTPEGFFLGWTPGHTPYVAPKGMAWPLDAGTDLVMILHLQPGEEDESVQARIGLYFSDTVPARVPAIIRLCRQDIELAPGVRSQPLVDSFRLPVDVDAYTIQPHAHNLAQQVKGYATLPDGTVTPLIHIKNWDFNWQDDYRFREPIFLPAGTTLKMEWTYDNTAANRRNPFQPPRPVTFGPLTSDEMSELLLQVVPRRASDLEVLERALVHKLLPQNIDGYEVRLRRDPNDVGLHNDVAALYRQTGNLKKAADHLAASLRLKPEPAVAVDLGVVIAEQGDTAEAVAKFELALALNPSFPGALAELAWTYATSGNPRFHAPKKALPLAQRAAALTERRNARVLDVLATSLAAAGLFDAAINAADEALARADENHNDQIAEDIARRRDLYTRRHVYVAPR